MKLRRILSVTAAAAVALSLAGCSIRTNMNEFESCITSIDLKDTAIVAKPTGEAVAGAEGLDVTYLDFKKEYLYFLKSYGATDDTKDTNAVSYAQQRSYIINYLVEERIVNTKAKEMGIDNFSQEEFDKLNADLQKNLEAQYEYFGEAADYGTLAEGQEITDEQKLARGKEEFGKYIADCGMTEDDLFLWQRYELVETKMKEEITKDIVIEKSEAEDVLNQYIDNVKKTYEESPEKYEQSGTGSQFWLPEGTRNIKHILIGLEEIDSDEIMAMRSGGDEAGADKLREEKLAEIKAEAEDIMKQLDEGADFDELISEHSADAAGSAMYPDGYTVIPNSTSYMEEFVEAAFATENIGEYVLTATDYGWHIVMYAGDAEVPQETLDTYIEYITETLTDNAKEAKYEETIAKWKAEYAYEIDYEALAITVPVQTAEADNAQ